MKTFKEHLTEATTIKTINKAIASKGYELVKGDGYYYFYPLDKQHPQLYDSSVMVHSLNQFTLEQWIQELDDILATDPNKER